MELYFVLIVTFVVLLRILPQKEEEFKEKRTYGKISLTKNGEIVRSKGEKKIADFLYSLGIGYVYEPKIGIYRPDFYLPEHSVIIEYFGMALLKNNDGDAYRKKMHKKNNYYYKRNLKVLSLFSPDLKNGDYVSKISKLVQ